MKKYLLLISLFLGLQINYAQELICTKNALFNLQTCLNGNNIVYTFIYGVNSIYIAGKGNPPPGKIQSCIAQYHADSRDCPDAPVLVDNPHLQ